MKLAIGTVQFGMDYGIANDHGKVKHAEVSKILKKAKNAGIDTLDTAIDYGNSEEILGNSGLNSWKVITKLPGIPEECKNIDTWVESNLLSSLKKLKVNKLSGLMLHRPSDLLVRKNRLWDILNELKANGVIDSIGYSIYSPSELDILYNDFSPDLIQAPYNIMDRRLKNTGWLNRLSNNNVEVHTRSCFLQGLLLLAPNKRPNKFKKWNDLFLLWDNWLKKNKLSALDACLNFVYQEKNISRVVVGIDNNTQLNEIIEALVFKKMLDIPESISSEDIDLINPANWLKL